MQNSEDTETVTKTIDKTDEDDIKVTVSINNNDDDDAAKENINLEKDVTPAVNGDATPADKSVEEVANFAAAAALKNCADTKDEDKRYETKSTMVQWSHMLRLIHGFCSSVTFW